MRWEEPPTHPPPTPTQPAQPNLATLEALYDAYHRQALGLAYRLVGNPEDAEEVVQEVFLAAWRSLDRYDPERGSTRTWLLTLVRHRAIDLLRQRGRRPEHPLEPGMEPADGRDVAQDAVSNVDATAARAALAGLPPEQQAVIDLAYFAGLSHGEIATRLAIPLGTVKGRMRLALDRLRVSFAAPPQA